MTLTSTELVLGALLCLFVGYAAGSRVAFREMLAMVGAAMRPVVQTLESLRPPPPDILPPSIRDLVELGRPLVQLTGVDKQRMRAVQLGGLTEAEDAARRAALGEDDVACGARGLDDRGCVHYCGLSAGHAKVGGDTHHDRLSGFDWPAIDV